MVLKLQRPPRTHAELEVREEAKNTTRIHQNIIWRMRRASHKSERSALCKFDMDDHYLEFGHIFDSREAQEALTQLTVRSAGFHEHHLSYYLLYTVARRCCACRI